MKAALKRLFFLPPWPTVLLAAIGYGLVIAVFAVPLENPAVQYAAYLASTYALVITCTGIRHLKPAVQRLKVWFHDLPLMQKFRATPIGARFCSDIRFRAQISLYVGFGINLLYIVLKLVSGILYRSMWFLALAVYYALLAGMRVLLVRQVHGADERTEWRRYQICGGVLLLMNQALAGIVAAMVHQNRAFDYPGPLIYGMAFYAFYAVIAAIVSAVRTRRHNSPVLSAAKAINLVAAMVSILSLETAMLDRFGAEDDPAFHRLMKTATGGGVCTIVIGMALFMLWRSSRNLKRIREQQATN